MQTENYSKIRSTSRTLRPFGFIVVTLRKRPTSEIRGPQTVGVIGQHNTAHEIPKIDVFISEQQITGI